MSNAVIRKTLISLAVAGAATLAQADVVIGVAGPHTGAYAAFGEQLWKGAEKAAMDINAAGGINGEMIKLVKADDACEPKQAVSVANRLVDSDEALAVVGHFCSSSSIPASRIYEEAGVLMVTPASTAPLLTDQGFPNVFRVCGRDDQQGDVAASYIVDVLKAKRVAIIHDKDTYGKGLADAMKSTLNAYGEKEVMYEGLTRGEKDFNALITKIRSVDADVVYFGGLHSEAGPLVRQLREQGSKAIFMSGDGIVSDEFVSVAGSPTYVEGVLNTFGADPTSYPAGKKVVGEFRASGYEPEGYTLYSYTAMQVAAAALANNDLDPIKGAEWLKNNATDTVMGKKQFDDKGDLVVSDYVMYEWQNGKSIQLN
ncbi:MAG: branched-chain amino acid ABC transporter substrate-binding protein [Marinomonas foliarum]|jgi:branched-chain amino acid transport system substrate-binding protein|uniref:Amino acid/amide ABC transporter substrate-binding protein (HAAT family) n=1 Tax=Marinomonas foliarum TaxID=491950 RepID=A0A369A8D0_9GAMM|nr:branched-chain amino acid ABC transporter substrate-binding protein [Marinomonas foliarum]QRV25261.1 branched-chain amino acid ABC transporter substrate-binding protein [Marinomonas foliarum]RCX04678.1 amino acid/amide ABC transporter substrate-binding protein (HAAT family) [Marinomonas foliarum]